MSFAFGVSFNRYGIIAYQHGIQNLLLDPELAFIDSNMRDRHIYHKQQKKI